VGIGGESQGRKREEKCGNGLRRVKDIEVEGRRWVKRSEGKGREADQTARERERERDAK